MRPSNKQRSRNKSGNLGNNPNNARRPLGNIINRVFESAGPDGKVRGTPQQIIDKYQMLARDAQLAGDRVAEQSFHQYAEHYSRLLGEAQAEQQAQRPTFDRDDERREERRDGEPRPDGQRYEGQRPEAPRREEGGFAERPRPEREQPRPPQPAIASGLVTIDDDEPYDGGLIDTPESRTAPQPLALAPAPAEAEAAAPAAEQAAEAAPAEAEPAEAESERTEAAAAEPAPAPKRGRPRRRAPRPEGEAAAS